MKIEKENNKKAFEVRFLPRGGDSILEFVFAKSLRQAKELASKLFASRKVVKVKELK